MMSTSDATAAPARAPAPIASFRRVARASSWRANVFSVECAVVLTLHLTALSHWGGDLPVTQLVLLGSSATLYMARLNLMARWILPRELSTEELTFVTLVWIPSILASFTYGAVLSNRKAALPTVQLVVSAVVYAGGSYLNSVSELQRKWWKAIPKNKGRCYKSGLFSVSRNINYFGDVVLFSGWAAMTGTWWNAWIPLAMFCGFYFVHIPEKEKYLAKRYAQDWPAYKASTKALIPWVL